MKLFNRRQNKDKAGSEVGKGATKGHFLRRGRSIKKTVEPKKAEKEAEKATALENERNPAVEEAREEAPVKNERDMDEKLKEQTSGATDAEAEKAEDEPKTSETSPTSDKESPVVETVNDEAVDAVDSPKASETASPKAEEDGEVDAPEDEQQADSTSSASPKTEDDVADEKKNTAEEGDQFETWRAEAITTATSAASTAGIFCGCV